MKTQEPTPHELARRRAGLTVSQLADRLGLSRSYVSRIERGLIPPSPRYVTIAATALDVSPADLFGGGDVD